MAVLTECALLDTLVIFSSLFVMFYLWMKWKHTYWQRRSIPSLPAHWFFGHIKDAILMHRPMGVVLSELHHQAADKDDVLPDENRQHGDTVSKERCWFGSDPIIDPFSHFFSISKPCASQIFHGYLIHGYIFPLIDVDITKKFHRRID